MKYFYLMRHGETLFNVRRKIQGFCDSPLTEKGIEQAKAVKQYFEKSNIVFDAYFCSTSERAIDTLELITSHQYTRLKGLKEMNFGLYEGESEDLNPKTPEGYETFFANYGGETAQEVSERMRSTCIEIMENNSNVLAVSHGGSCFRFLSVWQDPMIELKKGFGNCTIFKYEYDNFVFKLIEVIRL